MRRRSAGALGVAVIMIVVGLGLTSPAYSQACEATEVWTATGGFVDDDPEITSTLSGGNSSVTVTGSATREVCSVTGSDSTPAGWNDDVAPFAHTAAGGSTIELFVVSTRAVATSTTSSPTTTSPSTTTTTAPTTTSTSSSSTTSTTLPPQLDRGPGTVVAVRPDGDVRSSPDAAAVRGQERVDVVVLGNDANFYWTAWTGAWSNWTSLGGPPGGAIGDPTVVSWSPGRLDVFAAGTDGNLWQTFSDNGGANWSGWLQPFGDVGDLVGWPEASSRGPGRLDVFVKGTDGQLWQRYHEGAQGWNGDWLPQGKPATVGINGDPATTSWDGNRVDLFVWGSDNKLWQKFWNGTQWSDWVKPVGDQGTLASSPDATSWETGTLLVFIKGTDDHVYALVHGNGIWGGWTRLAGSADKIQNGPGATSRGLNRFDVFGRGTDNRAYQIYQ